MSLKQDESGRLNIDSPLMAESLMDKRLLQKTEIDQVFRPLPDLNVVKLGGQSIIDRGAGVVRPLVEEIVQARANHQLLVTTGGGTRDEARDPAGRGSRFRHGGRGPRVARHSVREAARR